MTNLDRNPRENSLMPSLSSRVGCVSVPSAPSPGAGWIKLAAGLTGAFVLTSCAAAGNEALAPPRDGLSSHASPQGHRSSGDTHFVVEQVTVISMVPDQAPARDQTVVVADGRIVAIGPVDHVRVPEDATRIDGRGRFLMPGLADLHVHAETPTLIGAFMGGAPLSADTYPPEDVYLPYVANGVVQVLHMSADADTLAQREAIAGRRLLGPTLSLARMIDGRPRIWGFALEADSPASAAALVHQAADDGYDFIKIYSNVDTAMFAAIVAAASAVDTRVVGHIPARGEDQPERFLCGGLAMVAHAEEFAYQASSVTQAIEQIDRYAATAKRCGVTLTTTLTLNERIVEQALDSGSLERRPELRYLNPITWQIWLAGSPYANQPAAFSAFAQSLVEFNERLVVGFVNAGVPILPGTDSTIPGVAGGSSLHDELEALQRVGIDRRIILESATRVAAEFLGNEDQFGTIEVGKRADLILLDADPLLDVGNTRSIAGVFIAGRFLTAEALDDAMEQLARRHSGSGGD